MNRNRAPSGAPDARGYTAYDGLNCYRRHGASDLESPVGSSAGAMELDDCEVGARGEGGGGGFVPLALVSRSLAPSILPLLS